MSALRTWLRTQRAENYARRMDRGECLECGVPLILGSIDGGMVMVAPFHPHWGWCPPCRLEVAKAEYAREMAPLLTTVMRVLWPEMDGAL